MGYADRPWLHHAFSLDAQSGGLRLSLAGHRHSHTDTYCDTNSNSHCNANFYADTETYTHTESCADAKAASYAAAAAVARMASNYRSPDEGHSWVDIWRCCLSIDGQRWQPDTSEQWRMEILIAGDQFDGANFCCNRRLRRGRFTSRLTSATAGHLLTQV